MKKLLFFSILIGSSLSVYLPPASASFKSICLKPNGAIVARSGKCLKSESATTLSNLAQPGPKGASGPSGTSTALDRQVVFSSVTVTVPGNGIYTKDELCPAGKVSLGGGCFISSPGFVFVSASFPFDSSPQQAWSCTFRNYVNVAAMNTLTSLVICGDPS
jgi:hypothetical protein